MAATIRTDKIGPADGSADFTLPTADGSAKSALITDGSKALSFATGTPSASNFLRGDGTWAAAGGDNTPSFGAYLAANQGLSNDTWTKITMDTEEWDTDSAFDHSTNYRFTVPSGEAGKYVFSVTTTYDDTGGTTAVGDGRLAIYKTPSGGSASAFKQIWWGKDIAARANYLGVMLTAAIDLAVGDAIEFYGYMNQNAASGVAMGGQSYTFCSGYKLL